MGYFANEKKVIISNGAAPIIQKFREQVLKVQMLVIKWKSSLNKVNKVSFEGLPLAIKVETKEK